MSSGFDNQMMLSPLRSDHLVEQIVRRHNVVGVSPPALMHDTNPAGWQAVSDNAQLGVDNADVLTRCRQLAAKTRQAQKCLVKVGPASN